MKVSVSTISIAELDVDLLFVPVSSEEIDSGLEALTEAFGGVVERARSDVRGDGSNATVLYPETGTAKRIVLVGLGTAETTTFEKLRLAASKAANVAYNVKAESSRLITSSLGLGKLDVKASNFVEYLDVRGGVAPRGGTDRGLVDRNHFIEMLNTLN